jgi:23S rRNA (adenine2030-N6)-methyltransferase
MPYTHYGQIGDIWKHLPLCTVLAQERPLVYVETNSAYASYALTGTPEQQYGVYHCYAHAHRSSPIDNSEYIALLREQNPTAVTPQTYLGSPGLALHLLQTITEKFVFYDLEQAALDSIVDYAQTLGLADKVEVIQEDSINATLQRLEQLDKSALLHIDPYLIFDPNADGHTYFDVFVEATRRGLKSMLWYGYMAGNEKREIGAWMTKGLREAGLLDSTSQVQSVEVFMKTIQPETVLVNPGIVGCGILTGNISAKSNEAIRVLAAELVKLYEGSQLYEEYSGDLCAEITIPMEALLCSRSVDPLLV